jgi:hypothetical protein
MKRRLRWHALLAVLLALAVMHGRAAAQESVFGLQFLGTSVQTGDVRARGIGVLGIAIIEPQTAIGLNPANMASLAQMTISLMGEGGERTSRDTGREDQDGVAAFPHERAALPLPKGFVVSSGFVSTRSAQGRFLLPHVTSSAGGYLQRFDRTGTLYLVPVVLSRRAGKHLQWGVSADFTLGTIDEEWTTTPDESSNAYDTRREDQYSGRGITLGVIATPLAHWSVGATYSSPVVCDFVSQVRVNSLGFNSGEIPNRRSTTSARIRLPAIWRLGTAAVFGPHWMVAADGSLSDFSGYDGRPYEAESLGQESRVGLGGEFRPLRRTWWGRLSYRAGISRGTWPQRVGGNEIHEATLHLGTGLDLSNHGGRVDVGFEYARLGALDRNGLEESVWRFLVGFSGQEPWRRRSH